MSQKNNYQQLQRDHLKQLISTRAGILNELNTTGAYDGSASASGSRPPRSRKGGTANVRLPKINKSGLSQSATFNLPPPSNLMLNLPSMSSTAPFPSSGGNGKNAKKKDNNANAQVVVKLPIFRMPTADATAFLNASKLDAARLNTQSGSRKRHFLSYSDFKTMRKALLLMLQQCSEHEKNTFIYLLSLRHEDFEDAMIQLKCKLESGNTAMTSNMLQRPKFMDEFFVVDEQTSLFILAKSSGHVVSSGASLSQGSVGTSNSSMQKETLRAVSAGMNLRSIGISSEFQEFLLAEDALRANAQQMSSGRHNLNTASHKSKNNNHIATTPQHKSASDLLRSTSQSNMQAMDSKQLSTALLTSLMSVQKHTNLMKRSLESAQELVNNLEKTQALDAVANASNNGQASASITTTANSKAKEMLFMLAAERLRKGMITLIMLDLRRGFVAWKTFVKQDRRRERMHVLVHALVVRNVVLGFQKILHRLLSQNLQIWHQAAVAETQRIHKERIIKATIKVQSWMRKVLATKRVKYLRQRKKYEQLYGSTIVIQALFRGKYYRWKYLKRMEGKRRETAARLIQRVYRGYLGRKRVAVIRIRKNRHLAVTTIQCMVRCHFARRKVRQLRQLRDEKFAAVRIQAIIRGFGARKNIAEMIINRVRYNNAIKIQARIRGATTRANRHKKLKEIEEYRATRHNGATKLQSLYRGFRNRIIYKIMCFQLKKEKQAQNHAATQINRIVRGFNARKLLEQMKEDRYDEWIAMAKRWQEMWSDDTQTWFYFNAETNEALWEPSRDGYIKADGMLVLCNGDIVEDPNAPTLDENGQPIVNFVNPELTEKKKVKKVLLSKLCSECSENVAIRKCHECGDQFCTKCYKATHNIGARRNHTFVAIGPKSCDDCECLLAERFCVSCDENFCDKCWRKLHSHGKRVFHPYCEISPEGRVDTRIFTMDGDQVRLNCSLLCLILFFKLTFSFGCYVSWRMATIPHILNNVLTVNKCPVWL